MARYRGGKEENNMDEISQLLKEAKPLYFARKRRNFRIKAAVCMVVCMLGLNMFYPRDAAYEYYSMTEVDTMVSQAETGSVIEEMGLPTDECGLLMVV